MENREFYIDCDGMKVHCKLDFPQQEQEKYHLLIIIPGLTGHIEETHILATANTALEEGYAILRSELYGHGASDGTLKDHTVLIWMNQAMRVIEYAKNLDFVKDMILSGHSQGGFTTVLAGGMMSDCLKALMPMSPATSIKYGALEGDFLGTKFDTENIPEIVMLYDEHPISGDYLRAAMVLPLDDCVKRFKKPVMIPHGDADEIIDYDYAVKLAAQYGDNAKLVTIKGDDHCYNYHLDDVMVAVREFLREQKEA